jgi:hypothetical protein
VSDKKKIKKKKKKKDREKEREREADHASPELVVESVRIRKYAGFLSRIEEIFVQSERKNIIRNLHIIINNKNYYQ